ncbi:MAG: ATP-binding protein [Sphaerochaetaceae bacterium]|nr:ATP-binding protein [Sphaerochaetaceae bacterium]
MFNQYKEYLINSGISENRILIINFDDFMNKKLKDSEILYKHIISSLDNKNMNYIFLDEIQEVPNFEEVVNSLYRLKNTDIYITGSNSHLLSGELATYLTGRYVKIEMMPLSFKEFISTYDNSNLNLEQLYQLYLSRGGFPVISTLTDKNNQVSEVLSAILETIIARDIMQRNNFRDKEKLVDILAFIMDNIGNETSINKISDTLTSSGRKISIPTVESYISEFVNSYLIYKVKRYDIKGKNYLKSLEKYYVCDIGIRNTFIGNKNIDIGHILENIVFLELKRRYKEIYVGKIYSAEVDFVALNSSGINYYQVSASVRDSKTLEREIKSLSLIKDHFPKYLLTLDRDPIRTLNGITIMNVLDWLIKYGKE